MSRPTSQRADPTLAAGRSRSSTDVCATDGRSRGGADAPSTRAAARWPGPPRPGRVPSVAVDGRSPRGHAAATDADQEVPPPVEAPTRRAGRPPRPAGRGRRTAGEAAAAAGSPSARAGPCHSAVRRGPSRPNDATAAWSTPSATSSRWRWDLRAVPSSASESDDEGSSSLDRIAPWLPALLALTNSPYAEGRDTGYEWQAQVWRRWPSAGPTERLLGRRLPRVPDHAGQQGRRDQGMLYLDARLSGQPTVEVRVCDVCTDLAEAVTIAVLVRGLVETAARDAVSGRPGAGLAGRGAAPRTGGRRAAAWGPPGHPLHRELRPAREGIDDWSPPPAGAGRGRRGSGWRRCWSARSRDNGDPAAGAAFERTASVQASSTTWSLARKPRGARGSPKVGSHGRRGRGSGVLLR